MFFEKLIIKNYRQYKDIEFDFNEDINIIEAENGIGKSTFMSTIIFALYGIEQVRKSGLIEDLSYLANQDNVVVSPARTSISFLENITEVTLILKINDSGKLYEVKRSLDNRRYMAEARVKEVGMLNSENFEKVEAYEISNINKPPVDLSVVTSVIPENIAPLLFFDGERINSIESVINVGRKSDEFHKEIEKILNIEAYEDANRLIRRSISKLREELTSESRNDELVKEQRECEEYKRKINENNNAIKILTDKYANQEIETKNYESILAKNEKSINLQTERKSRELLRVEVEKTEELLKDQLIAKIWQEGPKLSRASVFKSLNDVLSTGKSIYEINGMEQCAIDGILNKSKCICGTRLTSTMREELADLRETLPPESFESMLKSEVTNAVDLDEFDKENTNLRLEFGQSKSKKTRIDKEIAEISRQIQNVDKDYIETIELKRKNSVDLEVKYGKEIAKLEGEIRTFQQMYDSKKNFIDKQLELESANLLEKQSLKVLEETEKYLKTQIARRKGNIKSVLEDKVNKNIQVLMRDNVYITLKNNLTPEVKFKAGATSASSGQNVMISLAYLLGLMQIAKIQTGDEKIAKQTSYPIVMDGVTAKLDKGHTHSMVENILKANTQVIFLVNDQMFAELEVSIKAKSGLDSLEGKVTQLKRDKDTNVTYKVVK